MPLPGRRGLICLASVLFTGIPAVNSLAADHVQTGDFSLQYAGHYANVLSQSKTTEKKDFTSDLQRFRLELRPQYGEDLSGFLAYDHRILINSAIKTSDFLVAQNRQRHQFLDLDHEVAKDGNTRWEHLIYRGYLDYRNELLELRVGRQQIPWGLGYFWTPTDPFNPFDPLAIEKEERVGTDAIDLKTYLGFRQYVEFVYAPQRKRRQDTAALKLHLVEKGREFSFLVAEAKENEVYGADYLQNIGKAAFRMELTRTDAHNVPDFWKAVLNLDYTFPSSLYVLGEYHFNGQGRRDKNTYQRTRRNLGEIDFLGQDFLGLKLGYDVTPLLRIENNLILVLNDQSAYLNPEIRWDVIKNSELLIGAQSFIGRQDSEYGQEHPAGYIRWKMFF